MRKKKPKVEYKVECAGGLGEGRVKHRPHRWYKTDLTKAQGTLESQTAHAERHVGLYYDSCLPFTMFTRTITQWTIWEEET